MDIKELVEHFTFNIEDLPTGPVVCSTTDGPQEVDALLLGEWALNRNSAGWAVTHQRTGYAGKSYPTPIEALISLGVYIGAGLKIPGEVTRETMQTGFPLMPDIRSIAARIRDGLAVLEGWDLDLPYNEPEFDQD